MSSATPDRNSSAGFPVTAPEESETCRVFPPGSMSSHMSSEACMSWFRAIDLLLRRARVRALSSTGAANLPMPSRNLFQKERNVASSSTTMTSTIAWFAACAIMRPPQPFNYNIRAIAGGWGAKSYPRNHL